MTPAELDTTSLRNAIASLESALYVSSPERMEVLDVQTREVVRAGVIQNFKVAYELSHKMLKRYLEAVSPSPNAFDEMSFPDLIRTGSEQGLLLNGWHVWKDYRKARGTTSHAYDRAKADEVLEIVPAFSKEASYLLAKLEKRTPDANLEIVQTLPNKTAVLDEQKLSLYTHYDSLLWQITIFLATALGGLLLYRYQLGNDKSNSVISTLGMMLTLLASFFTASFRKACSRVVESLDNNDLKVLLISDKGYRQWLPIMSTYLIINFLFFLQLINIDSLNTILFTITLIFIVKLYLNGKSKEFSKKQ